MEDLYRIVVNLNAHHIILFRFEPFQFFLSFYQVLLPLVNQSEVPNHQPIVNEFDAVTGIPFFLLRWQVRLPLQFILRSLHHEEYLVFLTLILILWSRLLRLGYFCFLFSWGLPHICVDFLVVFFSTFLWSSQPESIARYSERSWLLATWSFWFPLSA